LAKNLFFRICHGRFYENILTWYDEKNIESSFTMLLWNMAAGCGYNNKWIEKDQYKETRKLPGIAFQRQREMDPDSP